MNKELAINYDSIQLEYIWTKNADGTLKTIGQLAKKYNIPESTLRAVSVKVDNKGLNWKANRDVLLKNTNNKVQTMLQKEIVNRRIKMAKSVREIIDEGAGNLIKSIKGYDFKEKKYDDSRKKVLTPKDLILLTKLELSLLGENIDSNTNKGGFEVVLGGKNIEDLSLKELEEAEQKINTIEAEFEVISEKDNKNK